MRWSSRKSIGLIVRWVVLFLICFLICVMGCSTTTAPEPATRAETPRPQVDPVDPLVASAALMLRVQLDDPAYVEESLAATQGVIRQLLAGIHGDDDRVAQRMLDVLAGTLIDGTAPTELDRDSAAYLALTPLGSSEFMDHISQSPIVPLEWYPQWFHVRLVLPAGEGGADALQRQLQWKLSREQGVAWQSQISGDRVVIDFGVPLHPDLQGDDATAFFHLLNAPGQQSGRTNSAARSQFARSEAPLSLHIDYRRIGQLMAIHQAATAFDRYVASVGENRATTSHLMHFWAQSNHRAADVFHEFHQIQSVYADATVELHLDDGPETVSAVTTRSRWGKADDENPAPDDTICEPLALKEAQQQPLESVGVLLQDSCGFAQLLAALFDRGGDVLQRRVSAGGTYEVLQSKAEDLDGEVLVEGHRSLPEVAVELDRLPSCAFDVRLFATQSLGQLQRITPREGRGILDRRILSVLEQARRCERHHPQLPQLSVVVSRHLWYLGLQAERRGRLEGAVTLYGESCSMGERLACEYSARLQRAATTDLPDGGAALDAQRPSTTFGDVVHTYITIDENQRLYVGDRLIGRAGELADSAHQQLFVDRLQNLSMRTPLALASADDELRDQAVSTVGLVAPGGMDAATVLRLWTPRGGASPQFIRPLVTSESMAEQRLAWSTLKVDSTWPPPFASVASDPPKIGVHLRSDGIQIVEDSVALKPIDGCRTAGPTICVGEGEDRREIFERLLSVMPTVATWRAGRGEVAVVVETGETELMWEQLVMLSILLQNPNHPLWAGPQPTRLLWFRSRIGAPYPYVTIALDIERD